MKSLSSPAFPPSPSSMVLRHAGHVKGHDLRLIGEEDDEEEEEEEEEDEEAM